MADVILIRPVLPGIVTRAFYFPLYVNCFTNDKYTLHLEGNEELIGGVNGIWAGSPEHELDASY